MGSDKEIERLRKEIAKERLKVQKASLVAKAKIQRSQLKRELFELQNPKKFALGRRLKRGFKIGAKKVKTGFLKQGRLIKAQQERETAIQRKIQRPRKIKKRKSIVEDGGFFAPLDF